MGGRVIGLSLLPNCLVVGVEARRRDDGVILINQICLEEKREMGEPRRSIANGSWLSEKVVGRSRRTESFISFRCDGSKRVTRKVAVCACGSTRSRNFLGGNFRCSLISPKRNGNGLSSTSNERASTWLPLPFEEGNFIADGTAMKKKISENSSLVKSTRIVRVHGIFLPRHSPRLVIIISSTRFVSLLKFVFERSATLLEINLHILSQFAGRAAINLIWRPPQFSLCISYHLLITRG